MKTEKLEKVKHHIRTKKHRYLDSSEFEDLFNKLVEEIMKGMERVDQFLNNGSGWRMSAILGMNVEIDVFKPLRGSTYG